MHPIIANTSTSPASLVRSALSHRHLILQLAQRDVLGRYRGSALGVVWSLVHPILMLTVYTFVFSVVFGTRWPGAAPDDRLHFAIVLFAGMIVFGVFSECVGKAPTLVVSQPNFVKKVVFPLEVMPWVPLLASLFHAAISFVVLFTLLLVARGGLHWTIIFLPLVFLPLAFLCLGLGWILASLGVFLRDIGQMVGVAVTALMFLSPLFYPSSALPERLRWVMEINPLAFPIEQAREVVVVGNLPNWAGLVAYSVAGAVVMWLGYAWFQRTRSGFADVL